MPTYEYQCEACGHTFEVFQSITADPVRVCPVCKRRKVKRLLGTGAALLFKGSGFYQTDYRSDSYKQAAKAEKQSSKSGEAGKSDSSSSHSGGDSKAKD